MCARKVSRSRTQSLNDHSLENDARVACVKISEPVSNRFISCDIVTLHISLPVFCMRSTRIISKTNLKSLPTHATRETMELRGIVFICIMAFVSLSSVCLGESTTGNIFYSRQAETRADVNKATSSDNNTESNAEDKPDLIAGLHPGAFYGGVSLLVLVLACVVLCSCLCNEKRDATVTTSGAVHVEHSNTQQNAKMELSHVVIGHTVSPDTLNTQQSTLNGLIIPNRTRADEGLRTP